MGRLGCCGLSLALLATACGDEARNDGAKQAEAPDPIRLVELVDLDPAPDVVEVEIEAGIATYEYLPGKTTEVWAYNGSIPGPLLRAKVGDTVVVHFTNRLPEPTTIHWHGVRVPAEMDGAGHVTPAVEPGESFTYRFVVPDAGTFWYHPHIRSDFQVEKGLYGAIVVEDPAQPALGEERTLLLDDVLLDSEGNLLPRTTSGHLAIIGRQGNTLLVNGKVAPTLPIPAGRRQHWRLINAANARYFHLEIPGHRIVRVGGDGGRLSTPVESESLLLVPGERAEIVLEPVGRPGDRLAVRNLPFERGHGTGNAAAADLFAALLTAPMGAPSPGMPQPLAQPVAPLDLSVVEVTQRIELEESTDTAEIAFRINGKAWPDGEHLMARVGETQIWEIENLTTMDHPFHLHGFFFQILDLDGVAPEPLEWKDTTNVPSGSRLRIAIHFDDRPGHWMFHCHILEHAELGMMAAVEVHDGDHPMHQDAQQP